MEQENTQDLPTIASKGETIGGGTSGIVELVPDGHVVKSPWPGPGEASCRRDITLEAKVYERLQAHLGTHKRFVQLISFDAIACTLTMEYMKNGTLRRYLEEQGDTVTHAQRCEWILAAAEGLALLHSINVIHCDFSTWNMLLDENLELKIVDFGCSSMDGAASSGVGGVRSYPAPIDHSTTAKHDIFALGSTIYEILTGNPPYHDLSSGRVVDLFGERKIPDLTDVPMKSVIEACWLDKSLSASDIHTKIVESLNLD